MKIAISNHMVYEIIGVPNKSESDSIPNQQGGAPETDWSIGVLEYWIFSHHSNTPELKSRRLETYHSFK